MRKIKVIIALLLAFAAIFSLSACGRRAKKKPDVESDTEPVAVDTTEVVHEHIFVEKSAPATCASAGRIALECECGQVESETILPALAHIPSETECEKDTVCTVCGCIVAYRVGHILESPEVISESTCSAFGRAKGVCKVCGELAEVNTPKKPHTPTERVGDEDVLCGICGVVLEHTHIYSTQVTESNCSQQGRSVSTCRCGDVKNEALPLLEHKFVATEGERVSLCSVCGFELVTKPEPKPTSGEGMSAFEVYSNAHYNTSILDEYTTKFSVSVTLKKLLVLSGSVTLDGNVKTVNGETTGSAFLKMPTKKNNCKYTYPVLGSSGETLSLIERDDGAKLYFQSDLAGLSAGVVSAFPQSAAARTKFADAAKGSVTASLTNAEVWEMYDQILSFFVSYAGSAGINLRDLAFSESTVTATVKNGTVDLYNVTLVGKAKAGNITVSFSVDVD